MIFRVVVLSPSDLVIRHFKVEADDEVGAMSKAEEKIAEKGWEDIDAEVKLYPEYDI